MFRKIAICSDGSESALMATRVGAQFAQKFHADVVLIHAYDLAVAAYPTLAAGVWELPVSEQGLDSYADEARFALEEHTGKILKEAGVGYETLIERGHPVEVVTRIAQQVKAITKDITKDAIQAGVPRSFHQETGNPADTIVCYANQHYASLIVIGCRGERHVQVASARQRFQLRCTLFPPLRPGNALKKSVTLQASRDIQHGGRRCRNIRMGNGREKTLWECR